MDFCKIFVASASIMVSNHDYQSYVVSKHLQSLLKGACSENYLKIELR